MANFIKAKDPVASALNKLAHTFAVDRNTQNAGLYNNSGLADALSMESANISAPQAIKYEDDMNTLRHNVQTYFQNAEGLDIAGLENYQIDAGAIVAAASGNPSGYFHAMQAEPEVKLGANERLSGAAMMWTGTSMEGIRPIVSMESFDEQSLDKYINYSIVFNVMASRQDEFNAAFFKPLTFTPDEVGYRVSVRVEQVWNGAEQDPSKPYALTDYSKKALVDALTHPEILESNGTDVIPAILKGETENLDSFVDLKKDYKLDAYPQASLDGVTFETAPLKVGRPHELLKLSSIPQLIANGLMNERDGLDSRLAIKNLYVKVGEQLVKFKTDTLPGSAFYKSAEGHMRSMALTFESRAFIIGKHVTDIKDAPVTLFDAIEKMDGYEVRLRINVTGSANVESGLIEINASSVTLADIFSNGKRIDIYSKENKESAIMKEIEKLNLGKDDSKVKVVGFDPEARRNNFALRTRGYLIDSTEYTELVTIPLRAPISIQKPIVGGEKPEPDVKALINAVRIQANNDGVKTILNHAEVLRAIVGSNRADKFQYSLDREGVPGIGSKFLAPFFVEETWHLPDMVNSVQSKNLLADIQGRVSTKLNELLSRILKETNYIPIVEQMTGGDVGNVTAVIGTDYRLPQYIAIQGDERLFGGRVKHKVVSTGNKLMRDKIVLTITRDNAGEGPDPFSYGTFAWGPELIVNIQRPGSGNHVFMHHMVQPRYAHIINLPILVMINLTGVEEVTGEQTVLPVSKVEKADKADTTQPASKPAAGATTSPAKPASGQ